MHQFDTIEALISDESFINFCKQRNAADVAHWNSYLQQHPEKRPLVQAAQQWLAQLEKSAGAIGETQRDLQQFKKLFELYNAAKQAPARSEWRVDGKGRLRGAWKIAAGVTLAAVIGFGVWYLRPAKPSVLQGMQRSQLAYTTYQGETGQRKKLQLADGTAVILNSGSRLLVPENFTQHREVLLDGEAFFDVKTAAGNPFVVKTDKLTSTVLGTAFRIRSFEAQQGATVYLLNGKIKVAKSYHSETDNQPEVLERGQMVLANKEIDLMEKETYNPAELETWLKGQLVLSNEPFMNVVRRLEDWYGVEITVNGDASGAGAIEGTFNNESLQHVLEVLGFSAGYKYKIRGNKVVINF